MARTRKPCPGCGEVKQYRPATEVCAACKADLELAGSVRAERAAAIKRGDRQAFQVADPGWSHWYPYVYTGQGPGEAGDELRKAFDEVVVAASTPADWKDLPDDEEYEPERLVDQGDRTYEQRWLVTMPRSLGLGLRRLYAAVQAVAAESLEHGEEAGRQLLVGLATGRLSVGEFNKKTQRGDEKGEQW